MENTASIYILLGSILYLTGFIPYMYHVFRGAVVPHPFSWTVWCILSSIYTYSLYIHNTHDLSMIILPVIRILCLGSGAIMGWYLIRRVSIGLWDSVCLILAIIIMGYIYHYGLHGAVIYTIIIDLLVLTPTLTKIWKNPESEDALIWILALLSQLCILMTIQEHTIENSLFWFYIMTENLLVALYIWYRMYQVRQSWRYKIGHFFKRS